MDVIDAINSRVSAVRLNEPGPTDEQLDIILKAAVRAPDHRKLAPWRLIVIEGKAREKLGQAYADLKRDANPDLADFDPQPEIDKAFRAPTIVAVGATVQDDAKVPAIEQILAVGAAVQNMFLAAHGLGLGAMWKTGGLAYDAKTKAMLGLKKTDTIVALLFLGTPPKLPSPRKPELNGCVTWL